MYFFKLECTVPTFNQAEDHLVLNKLNTLYSKKNIIPILCNNLAQEGGLLHCVSWEE